jgi:hypothetical protein
VETTDFVPHCLCYDMYWIPHCNKVTVTFTYICSLILISVVEVFVVLIPEYIVCVFLSDYSIRKPIFNSLSSGDD